MSPFCFLLLLFAFFDVAVAFTVTFSVAVAVSVVFAVAPHLALIAVAVCNPYPNGSLFAVLAAPAHSSIIHEVNPDAFMM